MLISYGHNVHIITKCQMTKWTSRNEDILKDEGINIIEISKCHTLFAVIINNKELCVVNIHSLQLICSKNLEKKVNALSFIDNNESILCSFKNGATKRFIINTQKLEHMFGHVSVIFESSVTCNEDYIATCDRDQRIRISHYPNFFDIQSFCLHSHSAVISAKFSPFINNLLVSCNQEGYICLWNSDEGRLIFTTETSNNKILYRYFIFHPTKMYLYLVPKDLKIITRIDYQLLANDLNNQFIKIDCNIKSNTQIPTNFNILGCCFDSFNSDLIILSYDSIVNDSPLLYIDTSVFMESDSKIEANVKTLSYPFLKNDIQDLINHLNDPLCFEDVSFASNDGKRKIARLDSSNKN